MQYKIPQNVQIADKIVGPLTLKQLIVLGIGGGITYATYVILARNYFIEVWLPPTAFFGLLTLAFTFIKIKGIPFGRWLLLLVEYLFNPRKRTFIMGAGDHYEANIFSHTQKKKAVDEGPNKAERAQEKIAHLDEITKVLDSYGKPKPQL